MLVEMKDGRTQLSQNVLNLTAFKPSQLQLDQEL